MAIHASGNGLFSGILRITSSAVNAFILLGSKIINYTPMVSSADKVVVVMSREGITKYSKNNSSWSSGTGINYNENSNYIGPISYHDGVFFAINPSTGQIVYSIDGATWEYGSTVDSGYYDSPIFGNGIFININRAGQIIRSVDGVNWTESLLFSNGSFSQYDDSYPGKNNISSVAFGNGTFVIKDNYNKIARSTDGISWSFSTVSLISTLYPSSIVFGNGIFLTADINNNTVYSSDGITWTAGQSITQELDDISNRYSQLTFINDKFINTTYGFNHLSSTIYSTDGITWTSGTTWLMSMYYPYNKPAFGNGVYFVTLVGSPYRSTDGINWTQITLPYLGWSTLGPKTFFYDGHFYFIEYTGETFKTADGFTFTNTGFLPNGHYSAELAAGQVSKLTAPNQGDSTIDVILPENIYTVPSGKTATIEKIAIKNKSANTVSYGFGIFNQESTLNKYNGTINNQSITAGQTVIIDNISNPLNEGQRVMVLPSEADAIEVKVYGNEE